MKLLISSIEKILDENLSLIERGILITLALCKDKNSKITLAKFKVLANVSKIKPELVSLHEAKYIQWSGYKKAKKDIETSKLTPDVKEAVDFMNKLWGRKIGYTSKDHFNMLVGRLKEHGLEDVKKVIANRYSEWKDNPVMKSNLEPSTIFRPSKFPKYLESANRTRIGESFVGASNINLSNGDEITTKIAETFIDNDTYNIKVYRVNDNGERLGAGTKATRYGKDIKLMLKKQDRMTRIEHKYFYIAN